MGSKRKRRGLGLPLEGILPDPTEIVESIAGLTDKISAIKEAPRTLIDHVVEADQDFREADKALRGTRIRGKKRG